MREAVGVVQRDMTMTCRFRAAEPPTAKTALASRSDVRAPSLVRFGMPDLQGTTRLGTASETS
jgi:hypothetical protein